MTTLDLTGRTAIITGASRGIGLATAEAIAAAGGNVVLTSRSQESAWQPRKSRAIEQSSD